MPTRVVHVPGENGTKGCYIVEYSNSQECHGNIWRKKVRYNFTDPTHDLIAPRVWDHVDRTPEEVSHEHGRGAITGESPLKHHGDPHENFKFKVYVRSTAAASGPRSEDVEAALRDHPPGE